MTLAFISHRERRVLRELKNTKTNRAMIYVFQGSLKGLKGVLDGWNKLAYSVHQVLPCCPDQA
jgi:hypothetical protein